MMVNSFLLFLLVISFPPEERLIHCFPGKYQLVFGRQLFCDCYCMYESCVDTTNASWYLYNPRFSIINPIVAGGTKRVLCTTPLKFTKLW